MFPEEIDEIQTQGGRIFNENRDFNEEFKIDVRPVQRGLTTACGTKTENAENTDEMAMFGTPHANNPKEEEKVNASEIKKGSLSIREDLKYGQTYQVPF